MRILLVEDDKIIGDGIVQGLSLEGYAVDWVEDREAAYTALAANPYELLVLDIGLPDGSGLDILTGLRGCHDDMPVLILTAYDEVSYRVKGLDAGADDYLVKPFDLNELSARIRALHRRHHGHAEPTLTVGNLTLDPAAHQVTRNGVPVELGPREFSILQTLMENSGRVVSKSRLEDSLYGWDVDIESNTVEVHVHGLRKKLGRNVIQTIRHVGYRIAGHG